MSAAPARWRLDRAARAWLAGPYFPRQLRDFLLIWSVLKTVNTATAIQAGLAPLDFRPMTEFAALGLECLALLVFTSRAREIVPAANLGVSRPLLLLPFVALHAALGLLLAVLG